MNRRSGVMGSILMTLLACGMAFLGIALPRLALAQDNGPLQFSKADRHVIRAQLDLSVTYVEQAVQALQHAVGPEGLESADALAWESYKLQRFAVRGVEGIMNNSPASRYYVNPVLQMAVSAIEQAMDHTRRVRAIIKAGIKWESERRQTPEVLQGLEETIRLIRQAADLI